MKLPKDLQEISAQFHEGILTITLRRGQASNAYSSGMVEGLVRLIEFAEYEQEVRVVVLAGEGKNFCAGGDIKAMKNKEGMFAGEANELRERYQAGIQRIPKAFLNLRKPVIASIQGAAVGAGCDLAAMCDLRIASKDASFAETFVKVGLVPGDGGAYFVVRAVGWSKACEMFLTCKTYSADDALKMGLVHEVVESEKLVLRVEELAKHLAALPPIALQMTKRALLSGFESNLAQHLELMAAFQGITQRSSDHFNALSGIEKKSSVNYDHR